MSSIDDPEYEPTKFRRKELSSRNSTLNSIIFVSFLCVAFGIANLILFNLGKVTGSTSLGKAQRSLTECKLFNPALPIAEVPVSFWSAVGIFALLAFVIAPVAKATSDAWSRHSTAFTCLAPLVAIICLGMAGASAFLGACWVRSFTDKIQQVQDIQNHPDLFYALIELLVTILGLVLFFQLLVVWSQIRRKRNKSEETKFKVEEEKLKKQEEKEKQNKMTDTNAAPPAATTTTSAATTTPSPADSKDENKPIPDEKTKQTPNVYFIQAPAPPTAPQPPQPTQPTQLPQQVQPPMYPTYDNPYDMPYYPTPSLPMPYQLPPSIPPPMTLPPPPPPRRGPPRPRVPPFRRQFAVRITPGYPMYPGRY